MGEPLGSLVLAVAVTVIEVGLDRRARWRPAGGRPTTLARDTVFAAAMITTNGIVGLCLLVASFAAESRRSTPRGRRRRSRRSIDARDARSRPRRRSRPARRARRSRATQLTFAAVGVGHALRPLRVRPERAPPRLLPAAATVPTRRRRSARTRRRRTGRLLLSLVALVALRWSPSSASRRSSRRRSRTLVDAARRAAVRRRRRHRASRAPAGDARRVPHRPRDRLQTSFNLAYGSARRRASA